MLKKDPSYIIAILACLSIICFAIGMTDTRNANATADIIPLNEPSYEHKKGIIQFTHKKHADEYVRSKDCGVCHHDEKGKPLILQEGDDVQRCIECHDKLGKPPKGTAKNDKLQWHQEAMHANCKGCHKAHNKTKPEIKAPTTCSKCHPKKEK